MREIGLVEGKDFSMEWRFAEGRFELFPDLAAELVQQNVDVIVLGTGAAVPAAKRATNTIPIVMASAIDPVGRGFVASLAHPGGNITGLASSLQDTSPKQVALLTMALPDLARIGAAVHPDSGSVLVLNAARAAAEKTGRELVPAEIRSSDEVASAFATLADQLAEELVRRGVSLMTATGGIMSAQAARAATASIPHANGSSTYAGPVVASARALPRQWPAFPSPTAAFRRPVARAQVLADIAAASVRAPHSHRLIPIHAGEIFGI